VTCAFVSQSMTLLAVHAGIVYLLGLKSEAPGGPHSSVRVATSAAQAARDSAPKLDHPKLGKARTLRKSSSTRALVNPFGSPKFGHQPKPEGGAASGSAADHSKTANGGRHGGRSSGLRGGRRAPRTLDFDAGLNLCGKGGDGGERAVAGGVKIGWRSVIGRGGLRGKAAGWPPPCNHITPSKAATATEDCSTSSKGYTWPAIV
jgi:hypothetical protein